MISDPLKWKRKMCPCRCLHVFCYVAFKIETVPVSRCPLVIKQCLSPLPVQCLSWEYEWWPRVAISTTSESVFFSGWRVFYRCFLIEPWWEQVNSGNYAENTLQAPGSPLTDPPPDGGLQDNLADKLNVHCSVSVGGQEANLKQIWMGSYQRSSHIVSWYIYIHGYIWYA